MYVVNIQCPKVKITSNEITVPTVHNVTCFTKLLKKETQRKKSVKLGADCGGKNMQDI